MKNGEKEGDDIKGGEKAFRGGSRGKRENTVHTTIQNCNLYLEEVKRIQMILGLCPRRNSVMHIVHCDDLAHHSLLPNITRT